MHTLCMATKTISLETDAYEILKRQKQRPNESFSDVVRRIVPAQSVRELEERAKAFEGRGAGPRRRRKQTSRRAAP